MATSQKDTCAGTSQEDFPPIQTPSPMKWLLKDVIQLEIKKDRLKEEKQDLERREKKLEDNKHRIETLETEISELESKRSRHETRTNKMD